MDDPIKQRSESPYPAPVPEFTETNAEYRRGLYNQPFQADTIIMLRDGSTLYGHRTILKKVPDWVLKLAPIDPSQHLGTLNLIHHSDTSARDLLAYLYSHSIPTILGDNWPVSRLIALHDLGYDYKLGCLTTAIRDYLRDKLCVFFVVGVEFKHDSFGWIWELAGLLWTLDKDEVDAVRRYEELRAEVVRVVRERGAEIGEEDLRAGLAWCRGLAVTLG